MYVVGNRIAARCSLTEELHVGEIISKYKAPVTNRSVYTVKVDCAGHIYIAIQSNDTIYPVRKLRGNKIV